MMNSLAALSNDGTFFTLGVGVMLLLGVLAFGWFDYRRTCKLPHLGVVMVKNRLKGSS